MNDKKFREEIEKLKGQLALHCMKSNVGVIVPACMEIVLNAILAVGTYDKDKALDATKSLHPMVDYIEGQLRGLQ